MTFYKSDVFENNYLKASEQSLEICDNVVVVINGDRIKCSKTVLSEHSIFFKSMFSYYSLDCNMKEFNKTEIVVNEVDPEVFHLIYTFLTSFLIKLSKDNIYEVIKAVSYLHISILVQSCDSFLKKLICLENCIEIYELAVFYNYLDVSAAAIHFGLENFSKLCSKNYFLDACFEIVSKFFHSSFIDENDRLYAIRLWVNQEFDYRSKYLPNLSHKGLDFKLLCDQTTFNHQIDENLARQELENRNKAMHNISSSSTCGHRLKRLKQNKPLEVIFAIGGITDHDDILKCMEVLPCSCENWTYNVPDPMVIKNSCKTSTIMKTMSHGRAYAAVTVSCSTIYVMGGRGTKGPLSHCERYSIYNNEWTDMPDLPLSLEGPGAAYLNGNIYVTGGYNQNIGFNNLVWMYNEKNNNWIKYTPMLRERCYHCLVAVHGVLYAIGGSDKNGKPMNSVECLHIGMEKWLECASLIKPRTKFACYVENDKIYVVGGQIFEDLNEVDDDNIGIDVYNVFANKWSNHVQLRLVNTHSFGIGLLNEHLIITGGNLCLSNVSNYSGIIKVDWHTPTSISCHKNMIRNRKGLSVVTVRFYGECCPT